MSKKEIYIPTMNESKIHRNKRHPKSEPPDDKKPKTTKPNISKKKRNLDQLDERNRENLVIESEKVIYKKHKTQYIINVTQIIDKHANRDREEATLKRKRDSKTHEVSLKKIVPKKGREIPSSDKTIKVQINEENKLISKEGMSREVRTVPRCLRPKCCSSVLMKTRHEEIKREARNRAKVRKNGANDQVQKILNEYRETERKRQEFIQERNEIPTLLTECKKTLERKLRISWLKKTLTNIYKESKMSELDKGLENISSNDDDNDTVLSGDMDISIHSDITLVLEPRGMSPFDIYTCSTPILDRGYYSPITSDEDFHFKEHNNNLNTSNNKFCKDNIDFAYENMHALKDVRNYSIDDPTKTPLFNEAYSPISSPDNFLFPKQNHSNIDNVNNNYYYKNNNDSSNDRTELVGPNIKRECFMPNLNTYDLPNVVNENKKYLPCIKTSIKSENKNLEIDNDKNEYNANTDLIIKTERLSDSEEAKVIKKENLDADIYNIEDCFKFPGTDSFNTFGEFSNTPLLPEDYSPLRSNEIALSYENEYPSSYCTNYSVPRIGMETNNLTDDAERLPVKTEPFYKHSNI